MFRNQYIKRKKKCICCSRKDPVNHSAHKRRKDHALRRNSEITFKFWRSFASQLTSDDLSSIKRKPVLCTEEDKEDVRVFFRENVRILPCKKENAQKAILKHKLYKLHNKNRM